MFQMEDVASLENDHDDFPFFLLPLITSVSSGFSVVINLRDGTLGADLLRLLEQALPPQVGIRVRFAAHEIEK